MPQLHGVTLRSGEQIQARLPYSRQVLQKMGFTNIAGLPVGGKVFSPTEEDYGLYAITDRSVGACLTDGSYWVAAIDNNDPAVERVKNTAKDCCKRGLGGEIPDWETIPPWYLQLRHQDPDWAPTLPANH